MDPVVVLLVAASAVLHVAWNVRLKTAGDPLRAATIGMVAGSAIVVPAAVGAWWASGGGALDPIGIGVGVVSGAIECVYFVLLAAAYRRGDLSIVYPIARGTAPLLLVAIGVAVFGERLGAPGWAGVACLTIGFLALQRPWRALRRGAASAASARDAAVPFALATGVTIAAYTAVDRLGTRLIPPLQYAAILWVTAAVLLVAWFTVVERGSLRGGPGEVSAAAVSGAFTLGAYVLILVALSVAPLTAVAPLRESATVVAATWGAVRLGEGADAGDAGRRIGASALIVLGAILLALPG